MHVYSGPITGMLTLERLLNTIYIRHQCALNLSSVFTHSPLLLYSLMYSQVRVPVANTCATTNWPIILGLHIGRHPAGCTTTGELAVSQRSPLHVMLPGVGGSGGVLCLIIHGQKMGI